MLCSFWPETSSHLASTSISIEIVVMFNHICRFLTWSSDDHLFKSLKQNSSGKWFKTDAIAVAELQRSFHLINATFFEKHIHGIIYQRTTASMLMASTWKSQARNICPIIYSYRNKYAGYVNILTCFSDIPRI